MTHSCCLERVTPAATLAPSRKQQPPARSPTAVSSGAGLGPPSSPGCCRQRPLLSPGGAEGSGAPRHAGWHIPGLASVSPTAAAELVRAGICAMGLEDRAKCWCWGPEPSCWEAGSGPTRGRGGPLSLCGHTVGQYTSGALSGGGQDHVDGQILGQPHPLSGQEEGARATPAARPAFPGMRSEELRLASFCDWPLTAVVRPEQLAAAGFFYTGEFRGCHWGPCGPGAPPPIAGRGWP